MNAMLILIPLAGLGLTGTLVLGRAQGEACKQQSACAATAQAPAPQAEPTVAERSLVRFLGGEQAGASTAAAPAAGVLTKAGQAGQGAVAAGVAQAHTSAHAAGTGACQAGVAQAAPAHEIEARRLAELGYTNALQAEQVAREAEVAELRARQARVSRVMAAQYAEANPRVGLATVQAGQAREVDEYTRSLERRIEALEQRLAERDHAAPPTPAAPPSVYYAQPGSGAKIVRTPPPGGRGEYWEIDELPEVEVPVMPEMTEMPEVIELEDLPVGIAEPLGSRAVIVTSPDGRRARVEVHPPAAVATPRAPHSVAVPRAPVAARAPEPYAQPRAYAMPRSGNAFGGGAGGGDLSELTRLIEEMRAQVGELQQDLESLRNDLSRVRASRNYGAR